VGTKRAGKRILQLSFSLLGIAFALLLLMCLKAPPQESDGRMALNPPVEYALASTSGITTTSNFTACVPLVIRNCTMSRLADFSHPTGAWPTGVSPWARYDYDNGAYKIELAGAYIWAGASPDWGIPNDATIRVETWSVEAWSDPDEVEIGLVFGLQERSWEDDVIWESWYTFGIDPVDQEYCLERWTEGDYDILAWSSSSAIVADPTAHQSLEVQHRGSTSTLVVNGTVVESVITELFTEQTSAGVYVFADHAVSVPTGFFDNFHVAARGCISEQLLETGYGSSSSISSIPLRQGPKRGAE
jgi:hypothetical protein